MVCQEWGDGVASRKPWAQAGTTGLGTRRQFRLMAYRLAGKLLVAAVAM